LAHLNLGVALIQLGDLDGAIQQFEEAQRIEPTNQLALMYLEKAHQARPQK
jgi:Flp pilus assembly protein TadD